MSGPHFIHGNNGFKMPAVGFGCWQVSDEALMEAALNSALEAGYRHIDTAFVYYNEAVIGRVLKEWLDKGKLKREDLFIVTKLPPFGNHPDRVERCLNQSLARLQLSYVDLYLIHVPFGLTYIDDNTPFPNKADGTIDMDVNTDIVAVWKKMEEQVDGKKTRFIGVSNFNSEQVDRILDNARIPPANNQIQLHLYLQQPQLVQHMKKKGIVVTSYSTLGSAGTVNFYGSLGIQKQLPSILSNPTVIEIAGQVGKSPAQVLLRHVLQKEIVVIPKSVNPERILQNIQLFDFELSEEQVQTLDALDENLLIVDFRDMMKGIEKHPEFPFSGLKSSQQ